MPVLGQHVHKKTFVRLLASACCLLLACSLACLLLECVAHPETLSKVLKLPQSKRTTVINLLIRWTELINS